MDELCEQVGRDAATLRCGVNFFDAEARASGGRLRYYDDEGLFMRLVESLVTAGYTDIGLYYPTDPAQIPAFERIATESLPALR